MHAITNVYSISYNLMGFVVWFSFLLVILLGGLLIRNIGVSFKVAILLIVEVFVFANSFSLYWSSPRYHFEVCYHFSYSIADKFGFSWSQYLLYLVNSLFSLLKYTFRGDDKIVVEKIERYNNCNTIPNISF